MLIMMVVGLAIGILSSGTGLGGGFLVVPVLIALGKEARFAVGTSFVFVLVVAVSSLVSHFRLGHVDFKTGLILTAGGVVGAQIGPVFLEHIPDQLFKRIFAGILIVIAIWLIANSRA